MGINYEKPFIMEVALGNVPGYEYVHKFGANSALGTSIAPVCQGGFYRTPTSAVTLAVISDSADDTAAGSGARKVKIQYLDANFVRQEAEIATNGTTESTETITGVLRVLRFWVSESGTYATQSSASQKGTLTLREASAGQTWATIPVLDTAFGAGQSLIGAYTVPAGYQALILSQTLHVDSAKSIDFYFFKREDADVIVAPFTGTMRVQNIAVGVATNFEGQHQTFEIYPEKTDIGYLAKAASASDGAVEFELLLMQV